VQRLSADRARPEVSVLLPYRDARATLAEALDSILAQRDVALELIAIDDGSRDGGEEIVRALAARDSRIVALRTDSVGIASALNRGLTIARAELIARMDADDVALPLRLATQLDALRAQPGIAVLGTRVEVFADDAPSARSAATTREGGGPAALPVGREERVPLPVTEGMLRYVTWQNALLDPRAHRDQLFVESPLCHPSVMLRRSALDAIGGYRDGPFPEDYDLWLRLDAAGFALAKLPEVLLRWRQSDRAATRSDPRYALERFTPLKAPHLAARLRARPRLLDVWGAGQTGRRLARALEACGLRADRFIDIDPRKLGRQARGAPIEPLSALALPGERWLVVALGARGARDEARAYLADRGYSEGDDYLCAS
jgi:glycosyltransferase involved in cell wall biosynthesis